MATSAERMRRHRDRQQRGVLAIVPVEIFQDDLDALIGVGSVPFTVSENRRLVTRADLAEAVANLLYDWTERVTR